MSVKNIVPFETELAMARVKAIKEFTKEEQAKINRKNNKIIKQLRAKYNFTLRIEYKSVNEEALEVVNCTEHEITLKKTSKQTGRVLVYVNRWVLMDLEMTKEEWLNINGEDIIEDINRVCRENMKAEDPFTYGHYSVLLKETGTALLQMKLEKDLSHKANSKTLNRAKV